MMQQSGEIINTAEAANAHKHAQRDEERTAF